MIERNHPGVMVQLTSELAEFLLDNCNANLEFGLKALPTLSSRDLQEKLVAQMEQFKAVRQAVVEAQEDAR